MFPSKSQPGHRQTHRSTQLTGRRSGQTVVKQTKCFPLSNFGTKSALCRGAKVGVRVRIFHLPKASLELEVPPEIGADAPGVLRLGMGPSWVRKRSDMVLEGGLSDMVLEDGLSGTGMNRGRAMLLF